MKRVIESGCLILVLSLSSPGYAQRLPEAGSQLERSLVALNELESEFGNNSARLVPVLIEMADLYRGENRFADA